MSTDTAETVTPYVLAEQLSRQLFSSIFPHDPESDRKHSGRRSDIPAELLIPYVEKPDDVEVDDILVVVEGAAFGNALRTYTARDVIMHQPRTSLVRVISKSAKSIKIKYIDLPRGNWRIDLAQFGEVPTWFQHTETRLMFSSTSREIGRLGTAEELRQKLFDHPQFAEWQAAHTAAHEMHKADLAENKAQREAHEARLAPVKAAVQGLADVTGERLVNMAFSNTPKGENPWLEADNFKRVRVYLAGLNAVGDLTDEQHTEAIRHLGVIIAAAKGEQ
jgi:hypothetical protein